MKEFDEHDDLWRLLGRAREPQVSPFFARNVVREAREQQADGFSFQALVRRFWPAASLSAGLAAALAIMAAHQSSQPDPIRLLASQVSASPDYQVINHLDELIESEHSAAWLDTSAY